MTGWRDPERGRRWLIGSGLVVLVAALVVGIVLVSPGARPGGPRPAKPQSGKPRAEKPAPAPASRVPLEAKSLPALPPPPGVQFGASVNHLFNDGTYSPTQVDAQLAALRATGATLARSDALWEATEPQPPVDGVHHYSWTFDDAIAGRWRHMV